MAPGVEDWGNTISQGLITAALNEKSYGHVNNQAFCLMYLTIFYNMTLLHCSMEIVHLCTIYMQLLFKYIFQNVISKRVMHELSWII